MKKMREVKESKKREKKRRGKGRNVKKSHIFGKLARQVLEVTASKIRFSTP